MMDVTIDSDDHDSLNLEDESNSNEDYETETSQIVSNVIDDFCCQKNCLSMFNDDFKSRLKTDLSTIQSKEKKIYLFALITKKFTSNKMKSFKQFNYTVKEYGVTRFVCKNAFIILHDTTPGLIRSLCQKMSKNHLIPTDKRGLQKNYLTISENVKELIKSHFDDTFRSPNIHKGSKKDHGPTNIHQLWLDFIKKYPNTYVSHSTYTKYIRSMRPEGLNNFRYILTERRSNS